MEHLYYRHVPKLVLLENSQLSICIEEDSYLYGKTFEYCGISKRWKLLRTATNEEVAHAKSLYERQAGVLSLKDMKWRDLALQFDEHRMQAIGLSRAVLKEEDINSLRKAIEDFVNAPPLSGKEVLEQRLKELNDTA